VIDKNACSLKKEEEDKELINRDCSKYINLDKSVLKYNFQLLL